MQKVLLHSLLIGLLMTVGARGQVRPGTLEQVDAFRIPHTAFMARTRITSFIDSTAGEMAVFEAYIAGPEKSLVIQKAGKNRDMKILYRNEKLWVALPGSRRPLRITPIQRLMGQASNGDVARIGWQTDYSVTSITEDTVKSTACRKLKLKARKRSSTYAVIDLWVRQSDARPVKADFFMASGKKIKWAVYDRYETYNGRPLLKQMTLYDALRPREKTVFLYEKVTPQRLPDRYYNKNYLVHVNGL